jgi:hypothetical protein
MNLLPREKMRAKGVKRSVDIVACVYEIDDSKNLVNTILKGIGCVNNFLQRRTNVWVCPFIGAEKWAWNTTFNVSLKEAFSLTQSVARSFPDFVVWGINMLCDACVTCSISGWESGTIPVKGGNDY